MFLLLLAEEWKLWVSVRKWRERGETVHERVAHTSTHTHRLNTYFWMPYQLSWSTTFLSFIREPHRSILLSCMSARHSYSTTMTTSEERRREGQSVSVSFARNLFFRYVTERINLSMWTLSMKIGCNTTNTDCYCAHKLNSIPLFNQFSVYCMPCTVVQLFPALFCSSRKQCFFFFARVSGAFFYSTKWFVES